MMNMCIPVYMHIFVIHCQKFALCSMFGKNKRNTCARKTKLAVKTSYMYMHMYF